MTLPPMAMRASVHARFVMAQALLVVLLLAAAANTAPARCGSAAKIAGARR